MTIGQQYALYFLLNDSFSRLFVSCCDPTTTPTSLDDAYDQLSRELLTYVDDHGTAVFDAADLASQGTKSNLVKIFDPTTFLFIDDDEDLMREAVGLKGYTAGNCPGKIGGGEIIAALSSVNVRQDQGKPKHRGTTPGKRPASRRKRQ
jgi:hypothetical protein